MTFHINCYTMFRVWAVSMRSTHPLKMTRNYCRSIKNSEDFVKSKSPNPKTLYSSTKYFELSIGSSFAVYQIDDNVFFLKYIILILELWSFLTETVIRKLRLQRSLFIYTLNLGRLLRYVSCVNFFRCKSFCTVHYGTSVLASTFFCPTGCRSVHQIVIWGVRWLH